MMKKTKLIFEDDVKNGYINYINFKRNFSGVLETWKKYVLPATVDLGIDANNDWIIITLSYDTDIEDWLKILQNEWNTLTDFLKEKHIQFAYPTRYDDWSIVISIDNFVEYVLKGDVE